MKIISGGQVGADIAGLRAAKKLDFETGGWIPKYFKTHDGPHPDYEDLYGLKETSTTDYPPRTYMNVRMADCTLRFAYDFESPGERCTLKAIKLYEKPHFDIKLKETTDPNNPFLPNFSFYQIDPFLDEHKPNIVNIAGNANRLIEPIVEHLVLGIFGQ